MLKVWIDSVLMTVNSKLPRRFKNRVKLIVAAIFAKNSVLEATMASIQKLPDVVLRGWGNPYDILVGLLPQYGSLDQHVLQLAGRESNPESSEVDVLHFLYNIVRHSRAKTVIEVGIYHGAGSLAMSQGIDENGGGEIHLVDVSREFLQDVSRKISGKSWKVSIFKYHVKLSEEKNIFELPKADIIFIDACHRYEEVKSDVSKYKPLVSKGGFLILHDTVFHPGPRRVILEILEEGIKGCSFTTSKGSGVTIIQC